MTAPFGCLFARSVVLANKTDEAADKVLVDAGSTVLFQESPAVLLLPRHASDCWFSTFSSVLPAIIRLQSCTASAACAWLRCLYAGRAM
jgi:hypothetical protein